MKKHFLLFMLTLMPLLGAWADNIAIMPANLQYTYGEDEYPTEMGDATAEMVSVIGNLPEGVTMEHVVGALTFQPRAEITGTGTYRYGLILKDGYNTGALEGHTITISGGDGQIVILGKMLTAEMIGEIEEYTFDGNQKTPTPAVSYLADPTDETSTVALRPGVDFEFTYGENIHAGEGAGSVKITAKDGSNYSGNATKTFDIAKLELASVAVGAVANQTYNYGTPITPALTVTGTDAAGNTFPLRPADYTVDYGEEAAATNINAGTATGQLDAAADGDFTFAADANVADATFTILPKNLGDDDITFAEIPAVNYDGSEKEPEVTVKWTIGNGEGAVANNITEKLTISYANNIVVGKGTVTAVPKENANPQNYTGSKTTSFDILPTSIAGAHIAFMKLVDDDEDAATPDVEVEATYQYEGREIKPGTNDEDGYLVVTIGEGEDAIKLEKGVDYMIKSYGGDGFDNTKASTDEVQAAVTIQGVGNYARVDGTGEPITETQRFRINKRTLKLTANDATTTKGVSPNLSHVDNIVEGEDLGGIITYTVYRGEDRVAPDAETEDQYTALEVGEGIYTYKASWTANPAVDTDEETEGIQYPEGKTAADYDTEAQVAARANYDMDPYLAIAGAITVNQATLRIVPQNVTVKYGSVEQELLYKVFNGTTEVAIDAVGFNEGHAPVLVREEGNNVGEYTISVSNQEATAEAANVVDNHVTAGDYVFTFETGTYKINPFTIAIVANDQTVPYGVEPNLSTAPDAMVKAVDEDGLEVNGNKVTVTFTPAMTGNQTVVTAELLGLTLSLSKDYDGSVGTHANVIIPTITNPNFDASATTINGTVIVKENPGLGLTLDPASEELKETIAEAENSGQSYIVSFGEMKMNAKEWYAMVLPFETTPAEIVGALGKYVVVNLLRSSEMKEEGEDRQVDAKFSLEWEKIPAGTPFLIKANTDTDWADAVFIGADLVEAITPTVTDFATFNGTYETGKSVKWGYELDGTTANADAKYRWLAHKEYKGDNNWKNPKSSKHDLAPMEAYLILDKAATKARIFVEDIDENGTTAIKSISAEEIHGLTVDGMYNLQGVKLQSAPTQKGVYINNGKKLIVK